MAGVNVRDRNKGTGRKPNWEYRFEMQTKDGKRKQYSKSGFRTKREAIDAGTKALNEYHDTGIARIKTAEMTLNDLVDTWYNSFCKPRLRYNTLMQYAYTIKRYVKPYIGEYKLADLTPIIIQKYVDEIASNHTRHSVMSARSVLKCVLEYGVTSLGLLRTNPGARILDLTGEEKALKNVPQEKEIISQQEFDEIMKSYRIGNDYFLPLFLGWYCGLRIGEVGGLRWTDIDFEKNTATIMWQLRRRTSDSYAYSESVTSAEKQGYEHSEWYLSPPKYNSARRIQLGEEIIRVLKRAKEIQEANKRLYDEQYVIYYLERQTDANAEEGMTVITTPTDTEANFVCVNKKGKMLSVNNIERQVVLARNVVGKNITFHSLRHSHASLLIDEGVSIKIIQSRLGHKKPELTMGTYVHTTDDAKKDLEEKLNNLVDKSWTED